MARKKLVTNEPSLTDLIPLYGEHKASLDVQKKQCESENAQIKKLMEDGNITEFQSGGYTAKYSVQDRVSMNEDRLLEVLKKAGITNVIKTREYVDSDLLEKALYNNEISEEIQLQIAECNEVKQVATLRVTKDKGGK